MKMRSKVCLIAVVLFVAFSILTLKLVDEWGEYGYIIPISFFGAINTAINIIKIKEREKKDD